LSFIVVELSFIVVELGFIVVELGFIVIGLGLRFADAQARRRGRAPHSLIDYPVN
jgi:hypothetical protein